MPTGIESKINICASGAKMASQVDTAEDEKIVNDGFEELQNWSIINNMKFNLEKCNVMHCRWLNRNIDYKLYEQNIHVMKSEKELGVITNSDMKFRDQVTAATK